VQPVLGGASARLQDQDTGDIFLYGYRPRGGDTIFDLGAGVGSEVRLLSRLVGKSGQVVSIEAHPRTFGCLRKSIELNQLDNVIALQCAVTAKPGRVFIENAHNNHVSNGITVQESDGVAVPGETLAEIVGRLDINHIDLLKMNIEGAELAALEAAGNVLPFVRNVVVSCHDFKADRGGADWQRTYAPVRALLTDAGYTIRNRPNDPRPWIPYYVYASR
jgi:FkbM family methyltransferase